MEIKISNHELVMILGSMVTMVLISSIALYFYNIPVAAMVEGFASGISGSNIKYSIADGVPGSWANKYSNDKDSCSTWFKSLENNKGSPEPSGGDRKLAYLADTKQSPECCPSTYSGSDGCVCPSVEQMKYLNQRGGNRTQCSSEF